MKIKVDRQLLLTQLSYISKAIPTKTPLPVLTGIKFVVAEEGLYLTTSDSDITINTFLPLEVNDTQVIQIDSVGSIIIPGKYFIEIIKKLNGDNIEISTFEGNYVTIKCGRSEYTLNGFDVTQYPNIELIKHDNPIHLEKQLLKTIIRQTVFSTANSENRPVLTGVNFRYDADELMCVATDSFRLSKKLVPLNKLHEPFNIVIPGRSLIELSKILDDSHESVDVYLANNQILFQIGNISFQSRLLDGIYPETKEFVPTTFGIEIKANYHELYNAFDRAALIARDQVSNVVKLNILPEESKLLITANSPEVGKVEEEVQVEMISGGELRIACSALFIIDALKAINNSDVIMSFNGDMRPFILRDQYDETTIQLIVPVRME
ncbi:DNA polymerase III subunit beta [Turicibacter sanguinis]|nr:DNA polymerase III subunit beta [Turicibacter sanguinis]